MTSVAKDRVNGQSMVLAVVETDATGAGEVITQPLTGYIDTIAYTKDDFADGVTFAITVVGTNETVWGETAVNASKVCRPRVVPLDTNGATLTGEPPVPILLSSQRLKLAVTLGGASKSGAFRIGLSQ